MSKLIHEHSSRPLAVRAVLVVTCLCSPNVIAQVSGTIRNSSGAGIAGALVRWQDAPEIPSVVSAQNGTFLIGAPEPGIHRLGAGRAYQHQDPVNYQTGSSSVLVSQSGTGQASIVLAEIPTQSNESYLPIPNAEPGCGDCHEQKSHEWYASGHSGAAINTWMRDLYDGSGTPGTGTNGYVFRATHASDESGLCGVCHAPNHDPRRPAEIRMENLRPDAEEGVTCTSCHQIAEVNESVSGLHLLGNSEMRFPGTEGSHITHMFVWGPLPDVDAPFMRSVYSPQMEQSLFCASCHEYASPASGVAAQSTYTEWSNSMFAVPGPSFRSCQDCHMQNPSGPSFIADTDAPGGGAIERPAHQVHDHSIQIDLTRMGQAIQLAVSARSDGKQILVDASIENTGMGHNFPTGISLRNAILLLDVTAGQAPLSLIAGPVLPWWTSDGDTSERSEGDLDGRPGLGFAKVLSGRYGDLTSPTRPVLFIDAEAIDEDSTLAHGEARTGTWRFSEPTGSRVAEIRVSAQIIYRFAWRELATEKGWAYRDGGQRWEESIKSELILHSHNVTTVFGNGFEFE